MSRIVQHVCYFVPGGGKQFCASGSNEHPSTQLDVGRVLSGCFVFAQSGREEDLAPQGFGWVESKKILVRRIQFWGQLTFCLNFF